MAKNVQEEIKKLAVLTSGGDASGMNAAIRAVVRWGITLGYEVYGVRRGYKGLVEDDIVKMEYKSVSNTVHTGGTILRTSRYPEFSEVKNAKKGAENLLKRGINNLIVIGGDGSFRGAKLLHDETQLNVVTIPGTIDNDMAYTEYTIGYDTACNTVLDAILKLRDTITSHDRIMILEVMGRESGNIALNSAVAGGAEYVLVPEMPADVDKIAASVKKGFDEKGKTSTIIILAEGKANLKDELIEKISKSTNRTVNHMSLSYMQRGGNPTMADRVLGAKLGAHAVELIDEGQSGRAVGIKGQNVFDVTIAAALDGKKGFDEKLYRIAEIISK